MMKQQQSYASPRVLSDEEANEGAGAKTVEGAECPSSPSVAAPARALESAPEESRAAPNDPLRPQMPSRAVPPPPQLLPAPQLPSDDLSDQRNRGGCEATNRETNYDSASSCYANRGHLQSILARKCQQQQQQQEQFQPRVNVGAKFSQLQDQYTQYRPSDFVETRLDLLHSQPVVSLNSNNKRAFQSGSEPQGRRVQLKDCQSATAASTLTDSANDNNRSAARVSITRELAHKSDEASKSLRRSVSYSLKELLKRPIELVRLRQRAASEQSANEPADARDDYQEVNSEGSPYKVPAKLSYASSSSLYLLPVPDESVIIAVRVVKEIILAYQRAKYEEAAWREASERGRRGANSSSIQSTGQNLINLIKTHSFRRSELESLAQQQQQAGSQSLRRNIKSAFRQSSQSSGRRRRHQQRALGQVVSEVYEQENHLTSGPCARLDHSVSKIRAKVKMPSGKSDKATIIDNKDGTIKISYEPKEVGAHELSIRYNDEPVDESPVIFYVDAVGSAKKKITAYGSGLTRGSAGEQNKFTINTGGLGSAKLNVTVEGPSKTAVELSDNKDGTITVSYLPLLPGEYKIKVSFDGKEVVGSPFSTVVGDEGRQRSRLSVHRGNEHTLDMKISQDEIKTLDAIITTPCGLEEPCGLKLLPSGQLAIVYTPRQPGDHTVSVRRRGNQIAGSPFKFSVLSRDIGEAKQVRVSGKGLKAGKANVENELIISTKEAGFGGLSVALEGPGRSEIVSKEETADGIIKLAYTPHEPGHYSLTVKYADHVVPGSPFNIEVSGEGTNPQKAVLKKYRRLVPAAEVNTECHFSFKIAGVSAYDLSARIHTPHGDSEDASVKDKGDFVYQVSFVPKEAGLFALSIRNKDIHIAGSPFPFTVGPLLDFGPHKVRCGGPGLIKGPVNKVNEFDVFTREAGAGELTVIMEGPSKPELSYTDRKDGSCHIGYKVSQPGEYRVSVLFDDQEVPESPFRTFVMANTGDVAKVELGPLPPDNMIQLDKPYNIPIIMNGAKGNIEGKVRVPSGKMADCFASPIDAENWGVRFIPREFGIYQVHIKCKGAHIPQSPLFVRVGHDNADPAAILVHGHGLKTAIVNHATDFIVETCNAGHSMLEVNIEGPSRVSMCCAELDEGYKINYTPLAPGEYLISIKYNGCHIGSSPFKVRATKQPGSKTIADPGSHEISTIAISTTDREAKQKVDHMPKFKSDATRVYCKGMGLKKAFAGKPNTLTVNCSEAGFNMVYASFLGPTRNTIHECSVKHMGGQIYEVKYTCKDRGDAMLIVKYGDEQIPGSPFKLECV